MLVAMLCVWYRVDDRCAGDGVAADCVCGACVADVAGGVVAGVRWC